VVSRATKLLGYRFSGSLANFLPPAQVGLARSRLASRRCTARSDSKEVWEQRPKVGMSFARVDGEGPTETEVRS
jgi:hypothetical protein